jgi:hypothetical protein
MLSSSFIPFESRSQEHYCRKLENSAFGFPQEPQSKCVCGRMGSLRQCRVMNKAGDR